MKFVSSILFLLSLCIVAQAGFNTSNPGSMDLIEKSCAQTKYKDLCVTSLTSDPNSFPADKTGLALVALRFVSSNASDIAENIKVMFNDTDMQGRIEKHDIVDCLDEYLDASKLLDDSINALLKKAYGDVAKCVNAAIADVRKCGMEFGAKEPRLLTERDVVFIQLCDIALTIAKIAESNTGN